DEEVVHRALAGGGHTVGAGQGQGAEAHVGHPLADLDVAGTDGGRRAGGHHGAGRGHDADGPHGAAVGRDGGIGGGAQGEGHGADRHRLDGVDVAGALGVAAGEVEGGGLTVDGEGEGDPGRLPVVGAGTGGV